MTHYEFSILRAVAIPEAVSLVHGVTHWRSEILLTVSSVAQRAAGACSWSATSRRKGSLPYEVCPDFWRSVHDRLLAHGPVPKYRASTHAAYLKGLQCGS